MPENKVTLPLDVRKQNAIIGWCLLNPIFFSQCKVRVRQDWFLTPQLSKVYQAIDSWHAKYNRIPTEDELKSWKEIAQFDREERESLHKTINDAIHETENFGLDALRDELTCWLASRIYRMGVAESERFYNMEKFDECYRVITERTQQMNEVKFTTDIAESFADPAAFLKKVELRYEDAITWGIKALDDAMMPQGMDSGPAGFSKGLLLGDTTIILAPVNIGKTTALITIARHNIMRGKDVLWFSHEGVKDDLKFKMMQAILGVNMLDLLDMYKTTEGLTNILNIMSVVDKRLTYIPWNNPGMTVEELTPIIERRQEERKASHNGKGYDLLVDDYPALLTTVQASGGRLEQRNIDSAVYGQFVQLALKHNFHALLAIQSNREGSKVNRDDARILTREDVRECWDSMARATNIVTMNRDARAAAHNRVTFYIDKSRSSRTGRAVVCKSAYECGLTHSQKMGATWYYGTQNLSDNIDNFMERFKNREIPDEAIREVM